MTSGNAFLRFCSVVDKDYAHLPVDQEIGLMSLPLLYPRIFRRGTQCNGRTCRVWRSEMHPDPSLRPRRHRGQRNPRPKGLTFGQPKLSYSRACSCRA
jgi:hypothetical protein